MCAAVLLILPRKITTTETGKLESRKTARVFHFVKNQTNLGPTLMQRSVLTSTRILVSVSCPHVTKFVACVTPTIKFYNPVKEYHTNATQTTPQNPYTVLGVLPTDSKDIIKKRYYKV